MSRRIRPRRWRLACWAGRQNGVVVIAGVRDDSTGAAGATLGGRGPGGGWCGDVVVDFDGDDSTSAAGAALGGLMLGAGVGHGWAMTGGRSNRIMGVGGLKRTAALLCSGGRCVGGGGGRASRGLAARHIVCSICGKVLWLIVFL